MRFHVTSGDCLPCLPVNTERTHLTVVSESWQKNVYAIAAAEFVVLIGFNFVNPFMPLFIKELGSFTDREAAFWAGVATGISGFAMFFSAPLWGMVADRWGRKPMVLRAQFGSAVALFLVGLSPNVLYLVSLRFTQGLFSGTVGAASALVASLTPANRLPFAMGVLMVAAYGGTTVGPLLGGVLADSLGFRSTFFVTSGLVLMGGVIVLFFVKEEFDRSRHRQHASLSNVLHLAVSREMFPLLVASCALHAGTQVLAPVVPLFIQSLEPNAEAATASGLAFALMAVLSAISAMAASRLSRTVSLKSILVYSCLGTALLHLPPMWAGTASILVVFVALTGLLKGGFMTSTNALVGLSVSGSEKGIAYGVAQSAQALGNGIGPLMGGILASLLGFKSVFAITAGLFVLVAVLAARRLAEQPPDRS